MQSEINQKVLEVQKYLSNRNWRLTKGKLYKIIDKQANSIFFTPNKHQTEVLKNLWYLNVILKARQLGMSTLIHLFGLDYCLFNDDISFGIIDQTIDDAKIKLRRIKHAYDNIPEAYRAFIPKIITDNKEEIIFDNGSRISVGISHRGGTLNILWVSEHAPIGRKSKEKEKEIRTGALNTVEAGQIIFLESTSSGSEGDFYKICIASESKMIAEDKLSKLDFKFFFFPWWENKGYSLEEDEYPTLSTESIEYFALLEGVTGQKLTDGQKLWYVKKKESLGEDMKTEFPSTSKEAFEATDRDKYYQRDIEIARSENRICEFPISEGVYIETWWDLGRSDYTSIIFTQRIGKELRIVDFVEGSGEHVLFYAGILKSKNYLYGKCNLPWDAKAEVLSAEKNTYQHLMDAGFKCEIVPKLGIESGINEVRRLLKSCWFRKSTTEKLINHLEHYKKKWVESIGQYVGQVHDEHSHSSDALRYCAVGLPDSESLKAPKPPKFSDLGISDGQKEYSDNEFSNPFGT